MRLWACAVAFLLACGNGDDTRGSGGAGHGGAGGQSTDPCADVDFQSDPNNCGQCGRTCVVPQATAACSAGECALASCDTGWSDCDGDLDNGCEHEIDCDQGSGCATSCGSTGALDCSDACAPVCQMPAETCNGLDDDCDTVCDNGPVAGCRVGVHRAFGANGHYYSTSEADAASQGTIEVLSFFYLYNDTIPGAQPLFRCNKSNGKTFLTTDTQCEAMGGGVDDQLGFTSPTPLCDSTPLYRLLNATEGEHFYTTSMGERDNAVANLGFVDEGTTGHVWVGP